jgi:hypothetical protein
MVEGLATPPISATYNAIVSGAAGRLGKPPASHQAVKSRQSLRYARTVFSAFDAAT